MGSLATLRSQADEQPDEQVARRSVTPNHYCLGLDHHPRLVTEDRFFYWDENDPGCPVCPTCNKQVNAQRIGYNAKGQPQIPVGLLGIASRIGEPV